jgi:serine protease Do
VTAGIVSARGRDIGAGPYDDFIQIDAAVNRGNSGGPTFNLNGEVVGVNTAIFSPSGGNVGIAFAVPASVAKDVVDELMDDGTVERGWLGVAIQPVTPEIAESLGSTKPAARLVADPQEGAPAQMAGIRSGDIITAVNGKESRIRVNWPVSSPVSIRAPRSRLAILRRGEEQTISSNSANCRVPTRWLRLPSHAGQQSPETALGRFRPDGRSGRGWRRRRRDRHRSGQPGCRCGHPCRRQGGRGQQRGRGVGVGHRGGAHTVTESGRKAALMLLERDDTNRFVAMPIDRG